MRMGMGRSIYVLFSIAGCISLCACQTRNFYFPEKLVKTHEDAPNGYFADQFRYDQSYGKVNVLFVVDNTPGLDDLLADPPTVNPSKTANRFQAYYEDFLNKWNDPRVPGKISYRVQMVTTPGDRAPKQFYSKPVDRAAHITELFTNLTPSTAFPNPFIIDRKEPGEPGPYHSTLAGMKSFDRDHTAFFIVYLLGRDSAVNSEEDNSAFEANLKASYGLYQTRVWLLGNMDPSQSSASGCPIGHPARFMTNLSSLPHQDTFNLAGSPQKIDICNSGWNQFKDPLFDSILDFKKKYILSYLPYDPETSLTVKTIDRRLQPPQDYELDKDKNEIIIKPSAGLQPGDDFWVSYYLSPPKNPLTGGNGPVGSP